jgi:hypothetical protein
MISGCDSGTAANFWVNADSRKLDSSSQIDSNGSKRRKGISAAVEASN